MTENTNELRNQQAEMYEVGRMRIVDCDMPRVAPHKVLLKVECCGVCGSDVHFYRYGSIGAKIAPIPFVLGHEISGTVVEVGEGVTNLVPGDRVAVEPGHPCGTCRMCRKGMYNLCPEMEFLAAPPYDGALKKYICQYADMCFKLPESMSFEEGSLIEPLAVSMYACQRGDVGIGKSVCILGGGTIGLLEVLCCKAMGASKIIVSDLFDRKLEKSKARGADLVVNVAKDDLEKAVMEATDGEGCDVVIEAAGVPATMGSTWKYVKKGGVIVVSGNVTETTPYDFMSLMRKEADIRTIWRYKNLYPMLIREVSSGRICLDGIVTQRYPFEESEAAFNFSITNAEEVIKVMIHL